MMGCGGSPSKYVCPNDRQLSLRAKLRSGWCVPRGVSPLTPAEQAAILEVIRRSEALGAAEARRVGRLVERVQALRRASPAGAGVATGRRSCRACQARAPLLGSLRACSACRHPVCARCSVETSPRSDRWLCNVCAETREMWKKSGAWFYRGLPQYVLPERRPGRLAASLQDVATDTDEPPGLARHLSVADTRRTSLAFAEPAEEDDPVTRGLGALSLARAGSLGARLRRTPSRASARSDASTASAASSQPESSYGTASKNSSPSHLANGSARPARPTPEGCGSAEVRVHHDAAAGTLHCTAVRARSLPATDLQGLADPYCCLEILPPDGTCSNRLRTKTVHKTKNPEFNETVTFYGVTEVDINSKTFRITLYDEDKYGCDILGSASIPLQEALFGGPTQDITLNLAAEADVSEQLMKPQILVSLCYNTKKRSLAVVICRCRNLPAMDSNGFSDPFVKLHLDPDPYHRKHKTSIKWRNLNPVFNEEFLFETRPTELTKQSLAFAVWDKDYGKSNDFLGSLVIGASSKGKRLKHWLDCIKFPDHRHEQWHCLTETIPNDKK